MPPIKNRAALYARCSTRTQDADNQVTALREFAERESYTVIGEYIDWETGTTADRPEFRKLFRDAARRKFDVVLFWSLDRFSREGAGPTFRHLDNLGLSGVKFRSLQEPEIDSTGPFGELWIALSATIAKLESQRIRARIQAGLEKARQAGTQLGRPKITASKDAMLERQAAGESLAQIAAALNVSKATVFRTLKGTR